MLSQTWMMEQVAQGDVRECNRNKVSSQTKVSKRAGIIPIIIATNFSIGRQLTSKGRICRSKGIRGTNAQSIRMIIPLAMGSIGLGRQYPSSFPDAACKAF